MNSDGGSATLIAMIRMSLIRSLIVAASTVLSTIAAAQSVQKSGLTKASDWLGSVVSTPDGKELGKVQDLAIDDGTGKIAYIVVSIGSFLIEQSLVAVDPDALVLRDDGELILEADENSLRRAKRFANDSWPAQPDILRSEEGSVDASRSRAEVEAPAGETRQPLPESGTATISSRTRSATLSAGERTITERETPPAAPSASVPAVEAGDGTKFGRLDADGDGVLNRSEIAHEMTRKDSYTRLDRNGNGVIDREEFEAFERQREQDE